MTRYRNLPRRISILFFLTLVVFLSSCAAQARSLERSGRWFNYNGVPTYLVGLDTQQLAADPTIDIPATLDRLAQYRINKVRVWIYCWFMEDPAGLSPWKKTNGIHNLEEFDDFQYWPRMRTLMAEAQARDIIVEVTFFAPYANAAAFDPRGVENNWWNRSDWKNAWNRAFNSNQAFTANARGHFYPQFFDLSLSETSSSGKTLKDYQQALVDKAIKELGSYGNVYFEIANEFAVEEWGAPVDAIHDPALRAWQETWAERAKLQSPRLVAVHGDSDGRGKGIKYWIDNPSIDVLNFRLAKASPAGISEILAASGAQASGKVLAINETSGASIDSTKNIDPHTQAAWGMFMAGGHIGFLMEDPKNILSDPDWVKPAVVLKTLRDIAESVRFWEMSPVDAAGVEYDKLVKQGPAGGNWQLLANPGSEYVAYFWGNQSSSSVVINLPVGIYSFSWYDVRDGSIRLTGSVSGGSMTVVPSPDRSGWSAGAGVALVIQAAGPSAESLCRRKTTLSPCVKAQRKLRRAT